MSIPLDFPNDDPQIGDTYTGFNGTTYTFDGVKWVGSLAGSVGPTGPAGSVGPTGPEGPPGADAIGEVAFGSEGNFAFYSVDGTTVSVAPHISASSDRSAIIIGGENTNFRYYRESYSNSPGEGVSFSQHHDVADAVNTVFYRTRGLSDAREPVQQGDYITDLLFAVYNQTENNNSVAALSVKVTNTSTGIAAGDMEFYTNNGVEVVLGARLTSSSTFETSKLAPVTGTNISVAGNIIPATDVVYDLGSPTNRFRDIYVSSSTIYIGTSTISISSEGQMLVNGNDAVSKLEYFGGEGYGPRDAVAIAWNTSTFTFDTPGKELLTAIYDLKPGNKIRAAGAPGFDQEFTIVGNTREYLRNGEYQMVDIDVAETTSTNRYAWALYLPVKDKSATIANGTWTVTVSTTGTIVYPDGTEQNGASISIAQLKTLVAASTDFADFQSRIAAL